ncbi:hypothetical protein [Streptococcus suis]
MTDDRKMTQAKKLIAEADAIVIGAGAGLSSAAGLTYSGPRFEENFAAFIKEYGLTDMYSAGFYPFATKEKKWGYWSQHLYLNRYQTGSLPLYQSWWQTRITLLSRPMWIVSLKKLVLIRKISLKSRAITENFNVQFLVMTVFIPIKRPWKLCLPTVRDWRSDEKIFLNVPSVGEI